MNILITGAQGYIGGRLVEYLSEAGGYQQKLLVRQDKKWPFAWYNASDKFTVDFSKSAPLLANYCADVDVVVHLAALNDRDCARDPVFAHRVNVEGTEQLLNAAVGAGVKRFIYLSTMHVYGAMQGNIDETRSPQPIYPYATTHLAAEQKLRDFHEKGKIEGVILRLTNSFGRPVHSSVNCWDLLLNDLARQAVVGNHMVLNSSGFQYRDFVPLSFVCEVIKRFFTVPADAIQNPIFNIGGSHTVPIREMVKKLVDSYSMLYGTQVDVDYGLEPFQNKVSPFHVNVDRLNALGVLCQTSIETELSQLLQFVAANKQALSVV